MAGLCVPPLERPLHAQGSQQAIWAYYRKNITDPWTFVGQQVLANYASVLPYVGLAVTSQSEGTLATATFSEVRHGRPPAWPARPSA